MNVLLTYHGTVPQACACFSSYWSCFCSRSAVAAKLLRPPHRARELQPDVFFPIRGTLPQSTDPLPPWISRVPRAGPSLHTSMRCACTRRAAARLTKSSRCCKYMYWTATWSCFATTRSKRSDLHWYSFLGRWCLATVR